MHWTLLPTLSGFSLIGMNSLCSRLNMRMKPVDRPNAISLPNNFDGAPHCRSHICRFFTRWMMSLSFRLTVRSNSKPDFLFTSRNQLRPATSWKSMVSSAMCEYVHFVRRFGNVCHCVFLPLEIISIVFATCAELLANNWTKNTKKNNGTKIKQML